MAFASRGGGVKRWFQCLRDDGRPHDRENTAVQAHAVNQALVLEGQGMLLTVAMFCCP